MKGIHIDHTHVPIVTAKDAIAHHIRWRMALQLAVTLREPLSARDVRIIHHPEECAVGKWLISRQTLHLRSTPEYRALVSRHLEFHREMERVAALIGSGNYAAAELAMGPHSNYKQASLAIANAMTALDRVQTICNRERRAPPYSPVNP
jgi:methyl-accepting chemotaxis protein